MNNKAKNTILYWTVVVVALFVGGLIISGWMKSDKLNMRAAELHYEQEAFWNEKDENGVSRAERMVETNRQYAEQKAERLKAAEQAAIEREATIRARVAKKLIELLKTDD